MRTRLWWVCAVAMALGAPLQAQPAASAPVGGAARGAPERWPAAKANAWYERQPWIVGANYINASAINQLEMFQAQTWNPAEIDKELGWAASRFGMNAMRVFLHDLLYRQDAEGFKRRFGELLTVAHKHGIRVIPVLFDSCWDPDPRLGPQHRPIPGVHNSGWVQSPSRTDLLDPANEALFRRYVEDMVGTFARDERVLLWDMWNEPDNKGGGNYNDLQAEQERARVAQLLPRVFAWARAQRPTQPLSSGVWSGPDWSPGSKDTSPVQRIQLAESDVITFHNYDWPESFEARVAQLRPYGRPLLCTEWMARSAGSTVDTVLPIGRRENIGMINWGFVQGAIQTYLPWDSWERPYTLHPPTVWFHDLVRPDGTPYREREAELFRSLSAQKAPPPLQVMNPVIPGDFPDPSVIRVGDDYYASATSSEWAPHFPIFHSKGLVSWEQVGAVFDARPAWAEANFWAPELVADKGQFFVYYVAHKRGGPLCVAVATAPEPRGPYTDHGPIVCDPDGSIDGAMIRDENDVPYLLWKEDGNSHGAPTPIFAQRLNESRTAFAEGSTRQRLIVNDAPWEGGVVEGPYILKHDGWFYLFYAGGACCGRACSYGEGVARSRKLLEGWEKDPRNPIVRTNAEWRCPGHGTVVTDPSGQSYLMYHAYSARDTVYVGRQSVLAKVTWDADGWPSINAHQGTGGGRRAPTGFSDGFDGSSLAPGWQWPQGRKPVARVSGGKLTLAPTPDRAADPTGAVLARFTNAGEYVAVTALDLTGLAPGTRAGLSAFGDPEDSVGLRLKGKTLELWRREKNQEQVLHEEPAPAGDTLYLRMTAREGHLFRFSVGTDGAHWREVGDEVDGDFLPPWDRGVRVALTAGGAAGASARFDSLALTPQPWPGH